MNALRSLLLLVTLTSAGTLLAASAAAPKAAEKTIGQIDGLEIPRPTGTFLGLTLVDNRFVLTFYDADKKKTKPDAARATLRWPVRYQASDERVVLNLAADGFSLTAAKVIRPPHDFRLYLALFVEGDPDPIETHNVQFSAP